MDDILTGAELRYKKPVLRAKFTGEELFEVNLPDTEPDAGKALATFAAPLLRSKDAEAGRMTVAGVADITVLFVPENGEGIRKISVSRDFSAYRDSPEVDASSELVADVSVALCEARLLNSRKLQVRLELLYSFEAYADESLSYTEAISSEKIEAQYTETSVTLPAAVGEKTFTLTDNLSVPTLSELLGATVSFKLEDVRSVGAKAVVRGSAQVRAFYISRDKTIGSSTFSSPFSQIVELDCDDELHLFDAVTAATGLYLQRDYGADEAGAMSLELHAVVQVTGYKTHKITAVTDAYATDGELKTEITEIPLTSLEGFSEREYAVSLEFTTAKPVLSIDAVLATAGMWSETASGAELPVNVTTVYTSDDGDTCSSTRSAAADAEPGENTRLCSLFADGQSAEYNRTENGAAVRLALIARAKTEKAVSLKFISSAELTEAESETEAPSIIACRMAEGETLWAIAKRYRAAKKAVLEANSLENEEEIAVGDLILIPKK